MIGALEQTRQSGGARSSGAFIPRFPGCVGAYLGSHFTGEGAERVRRGTERLAGLVLVTLATFLFTGTLQVA
jgi:hypothetical protein